MKENRPKLRIVLNARDKIFEISGWILVPLIWIFAIYYFLKLPQIIPTHFNSDGIADNFGNKTSLFIIPIITTVLFTALSFLNKFPHLFNYRNEITPENALRQYTSATRLIRYLKNMITLIFGIILTDFVGNIYNQSVIPSVLVLPVILLLLILPVLFMLFKNLNNE